MFDDKEYYSFGDIKFRAREMLWLIRNLAILKEGRYPPDPVGGSSYVDLQGRRTGRRRAYFENPALIAAEVESRLAMCGRDGLILKAIVLWEETPEYLAKCLGIAEWGIIERKASALRYISGGRRKLSTYREYLGHRRASKAKGGNAIRPTPFKSPRF